MTVTGREVSRARIEEIATRLWEGDHLTRSFPSDDFVRSVAIARDGDALYGGYDGAVVRRRWVTA